jgi:hypothetical protein
VIASRSSILSLPLLAALAARRMLVGLVYRATPATQAATM